MSEKLTKDAIDLSTLSIPRLFGRYFLPTLLGMLSISAMTAIDGIFVGNFPMLKNVFLHKDTKKNLYV